MAERRRDPLILDLEAERIPDAPSPSEAPPPDDPDPPAAAETALRKAAHGPRRVSALGMAVWSAIGALATLYVGVQLEAFVSGLFARWSALGWIGIGLLAILGAAIVVLVLGEIAGVARLRRIESVRRDAEKGAKGDDRAATRALKGLQGLYSDRASQRGALRELAAARADTPDLSALLEIAERQLMSPLDARAEKIVARSAREVAGLTALVPISLLDVLLVLIVNLRMIRRVAETYGGRAGWLGSWRLMRAVASHLVASGMIAVTDDLLGPMVGHGLVGAVSRRAGEAAVNGALTARVGASAIDVCRPLPFTVREAPRARGLVAQALGARRRGGDG